MNPRLLWRLSVIIPAEAEEAVTEILVDRLGQPACTYIDLETGKTTVSVYLKIKPDWSTAARDQLRNALNQMEALGSKAAPPKIRLTKLPTEDWAEAWKRHFKP